MPLWQDFPCYEVVPLWQDFGFDEVINLNEVVSICDDFMKDIQVFVIWNDFIPT